MDLFVHNIQVYQGDLATTLKRGIEIKRGIEMIAFGCQYITKFIEQWWKAMPSCVGEQYLAALVSTSWRPPAKRAYLLYFRILSLHQNLQFYQLNFGNEIYLNGRDFNNPYFYNIKSQIWISSISPSIQIHLRRFSLSFIRKENN